MTPALPDDDAARRPTENGSSAGGRRLTPPPGKPPARIGRPPAKVAGSPGSVPPAPVPVPAPRAGQLGAGAGQPGVPVVPPLPPFPSPPSGSAKGTPPGQQQYEDSRRSAVWLVGVAAVPLVIAGLAISALVAVKPTWWSGQARARAIIDAWARQEDGRPPYQIEEPTAETWLAAYGGPRAWDAPSRNGGLDDELVAQVLGLLNSALLTTAVSPDTIKTDNEVQRVIEELRALQAGAIDALGLHSIGVMLPRGDSRTTVLIVDWINERVGETGLPQPSDNPIDDVQRWVDQVRPLASIAATADRVGTGGSAEIAAIRRAIEFAFTDLDPQEAAPGFQSRLVEFAQQIAENPQTIAGVESLQDLRAAYAAFSTRAQVFVDDGARHPPQANRDSAFPSLDGGAADYAGGQAERAAKNQSAWEAFVARIDTSMRERRDWPEDEKPVAIVRGINGVEHIDWERIDVVVGRLPRAWQPEAVRTRGTPEWSLHGLPDGDVKPWGTIRLEPESAEGTWQLVFKALPDAPWICGWVPIVFVHRDVPNQPTSPLRVATTARTSVWEIAWSPLADAPTPSRKGASSSTAVARLKLSADPLLMCCSPGVDISAQETVAGPLRARATAVNGDRGVIEMTLSTDESPLVRRFVWQLAREDASLAVLLKADSRGSLAAIDGAPLSPQELDSMPASRWVTIVRSVVHTKLAEASVQSWPRDELEKRIGIVNVNNRMSQQNILKALEDTVAARLRDWEDAVAQAQSNPARVTQADRALTDARNREAAQRDRVDASSEELNVYAPWVYPAVGKDERGKEVSRSLADWKQMAVEYVTSDGRYFEKHSDKPTRKEAIRAASTSAFVRDFLGRHAAWKDHVTSTFNDTPVSKAEQNELLALVLLAHVDETMAAQQDRVEQLHAMRQWIPRVLRASLELSWTIVGVDKPVVVTVATVGDHDAGGGVNAITAGEGPLGQ